MDNNAFLDLIRDRAKKTATFVQDAARETTRQYHILHGTRLVLITASAVTGAALGVTIGLAVGRR